MLNVPDQSPTPAQASNPKRFRALELCAARFAVICPELSKDHFRTIMNKLWNGRLVIVRDSDRSISIH